MAYELQGDVACTEGCCLIAWDLEMRADFLFSRSPHVMDGTLGDVTLAPLFSVKQDIHCDPVKDPDHLFCFDGASGMRKSDYDDPMRWWL